MKRNNRCGNLYIVTFCGLEILPLEFYTKSAAEQIAKRWNRHIDRKNYKAVKFDAYCGGKWK